MEPNILPRAGGMRRVLKNQEYHLLAYAILGGSLYFSTRQFYEPRNSIWGPSASEWIAVSWMLAGLHQAYIVIFARLALYTGTIRTWFGELGFPIFKTGFLLLGPARLLTVVPVSLSTANTLPLPRWASLALIVVTTPFILWTFYSFAAYFGVDRAMCADHFDPSYRGKTLERRGIFRFTRNAGYAVGILIIYHAGLLWQSLPGLLVAAAHHAFIWCAYFSFEKPDLREIYGNTAAKGGQPKAQPNSIDPED